MLIHGWTLSQWICLRTREPLIRFEKDFHIQPHSIEPDLTSGQLKDLQKTTHIIHLSLFIITLFDEHGIDCDVGRIEK